MCLFLFRYISRLRFTISFGKTVKNSIYLISICRSFQRIISDSHFCFSVTPLSLLKWLYLWTQGQSDCKLPFMNYDWLKLPGAYWIIIGSTLRHPDAHPRFIHIRECVHWSLANMRCPFTDGRAIGPSNCPYQTHSVHK